MLNFSTDQWVIILLIFVLGLLIGGFLFSGGGRKWKTRYNTEVDRRTELERTHTAREKEWREQDSLRAAALKDRERDAVIDERKGVIDRRGPVVDRRDSDGDDVPDNRDPAVTRDRDADGTPDNRDPVDNRKV